MKTNDQNQAARYRGPVKAVVVDWAGTTLDYGSCAPVVAFVEAFRQAGVEITSHEARLPMGTAKLAHIRQILAMPAVVERWKQAHGTTPEEADARTIYERFVPVQLECLGRHSELIPGTLAMQEYCRKHDIRIGSTTGYVRELMDLLVPLGREHGFEPEAVVCASDVSVGRPGPWMNLESLRQLNVYPVSSAVAVDDTIVGVEAGVNAGMWSVGVTKSGNELGLSRAEAEGLPKQEFEQRLSKAQERMLKAGAHYVIESVAEMPLVLQTIAQRLRDGDRP